MQVQEMNDSTIIRMVNPAGDVTEINDSRFGLRTPDVDHAVYVPQEAQEAMEKAGFRRRELTNAEKLRRISDLAADLDEPDRIAIQSAISSQSLLVWRAMQAANAPA
jgi:hypothetical protein